MPSICSLWKWPASHSRSAIFWMPAYRPIFWMWSNGSAHTMTGRSAWPISQSSSATTLPTWPTYLKNIPAIRSWPISTASGSPSPKTCSPTARFPSTKSQILAVSRMKSISWSCSNAMKASLPPNTGKRFTRKKSTSHDHKDIQTPSASILMHRKTPAQTAPAPPGPSPPSSHRKSAWPAGPHPDPPSSWADGKKW